MNRRRRFGVLVALSAALTLRTACSCGGDDTSVDGGTDAAADRRKDVAADATDADPGPCGATGYALEEEYDPTCGFCYATDAKFLPPPIRWEPCDLSATPQGMNCRQMVQDWTSTVPFAGKERISGGTQGWVAPDGSVELNFSRFVDDSVYRMVAKADGPVMQAILETHYDRCTIAGLGIGFGHVAYVAYDFRQKKSGDDAIGGLTTDLKPHRLSWHRDGNPRDFYPVSGANVEVSLGDISRVPWDALDAGQTLATASDGFRPFSPAGGPDGPIFWRSSNSTILIKTSVWTSDAGTKDFISFGNDFTKGAGGLGTDGKDLVWQSLSGRSNTNDPFDSGAVMTAPYVTSSSALVPRRLRSDSGILGDRFVVGCGWAAQYTTLANESGLLLVRLSDGRGWTFGAPITADWQWQNPIALTCEELFAVVLYDKHSRHGVVRVRLDSLGPGQPPD